MRVLRPQHRSPAIGAAAVLTGALLFGLNGSMSKVVLQAGISPEQLTLFRVAGTTVIAGAVLLVSDRSQFRLSRSDLAWFAALGVGGLAMVQWLYSIAISLLPVGVALLFEYTAVILIALAAWALLKERVHPRLWWAIGAVLAGLALVAEAWNTTLSGLGILAGLGAAVAYAFYFLAGERSVAGRPPMAVAFWASMFATAFWLPLSGWWDIPNDALTESVAFGGNLNEITTPLWLPLTLIIVLGGFAPFTLIFVSLRHISATASGILACSEVLFAFIVAWLWLNETLSSVQLAGAAIVFAGIVVAQTARERSVVEGEHVDGFAAGVPSEAP